jgi:hypothetical protein
MGFDFQAMMADLPLDRARAMLGEYRMRVEAIPGGWRATHDEQGLVFTATGTDERACLAELVAQATDHGFNAMPGIRAFLERAHETMPEAMFAGFASIFGTAVQLMEHRIKHAPNPEAEAELVRREVQQIFDRAFERSRRRRERAAHQAAKRRRMPGRYVRR